MLKMRRVTKMHSAGVRGARHVLLAVVALFMLLAVISCRCCLTEDREDRELGHRIPLYVLPYYDSSGPSIAVGRYTELLSVSRKKDILRSFSRLKSDISVLRPEVMFVASIRSYDIGLKEESLYWYYMAAYRSSFFSQIVQRDREGSALFEVIDLVSCYESFTYLVREYVNMYLTDGMNMQRKVEVLRQVGIDAKAMPDIRSMYPDLPFRGGEAMWNGIRDEMQDEFGRFVDGISDGSILRELKEEEVREEQENADRRAGGRRQESKEELDRRVHDSIERAIAEEKETEQGKEQGEGEGEEGGEGEE